MLLFRSEGHRDKGLAERNLSHGASFSVEQQWELARLWYGPPHDRTSPEWRRRTPDEAEAVFDSLGLTGDFWRLSD